MSEAVNIKPHGAYAPSFLLRLILKMTRSTGKGWFAKRLSFLLRRLSLLFIHGPVDAKVFNLAMRLYPQANVCEKRMLFTPQYFDAEERDFLNKNLSQGDLFIDIGANVGGYALYAASLVGGRGKVFALEPQLSIYERLIYNIEANDLDRVKAFMLALCDKDGKISLFIDQTNFGEASMKHVGYGERGGESVEVEALSLLSFLGREKIERIHGLKIDIEGAEDIVLKAFFENAPLSLYPSFIIIENSLSSWQTDCFQLMAHKGYRCALKTKLNSIYVLDSQHLEAVKD